MADGELRKELDTLKTEFSKLQADTADLLNELKQVASKKVKNARSKIKENVEDSEEEIINRFEDARIKGRELIENVEGHVSDHPVSSLVAAFGVGFVVAKLLRNRSVE